MAINYDTHNNVSIVMPKDLHQSLKALAKKSRRSVSAQVCVLVEEAIKKEEEETK